MNQSRPFTVRTLLSIGILLLLAGHVDAGPYSFNADRFHVLGNLPVDCADEFDGNAQATEGIHLRRRDILGQKDHPLVFQLFHHVGDGAAVVARGGGDDAALALVFRQCEDSVGRAPQFERSRDLEVFELEENVATAIFGEGGRWFDGRHPDMPLDALPRLAHFIQQTDAQFFFDVEHARSLS